MVYNSNYRTSSGNAVAHEELWGDLARSIFPETQADRLALSAFLFERHGTYAQSIRKAVSYFSNPFEIVDNTLPAVERSKYENTINTERGFQSAVIDIGSELIAYGTVFLTVHIPFVRNLRCQQCGSLYQLEAYIESDVFEFHTSYDGEGPAFTGKCPNKDCDNHTISKEFEVVDQYRDNKNGDISIEPVLVPPTIMRLIPNYLTNNVTPVMETYRYTELVNSLNNKVPEALLHTRWEYIQSALMKRPLIMTPETMHVSRIQPSSAERPLYKGWGKPGPLAAFPEAARLILLETYNDVITKEMSVPRRVISPPPVAQSLQNSKGGGQAMSLDLVNMVKPSDFLNKMSSMVQQMRNDPSGIGVSPFAFHYQVMGAEAGKLITHEQLEAAERKLLRSMGIPPELHMGGIQAHVATPTMFGFKMFERTWSSARIKMESAANWLKDRHAERMQWPQFQIRSTDVSMLVDPTVIQEVAAGHAANKISDRTYGRVIGIDMRAEKNILEYERELDQRNMEDKSIEQQTDEGMRSLVEGAAINAEMMKQEQSVQQALQSEQEEEGGAPSEGGAPMPPTAGGGASMPPASGGTPAPGQGAAPPTGQDLGAYLGIPELQGMSMPNNGSIEQIRAIAKQIAQQIFTVPVNQRSQITEQIKSKDQNLHLFLMAELDAIEADAKRQGLAAARQGQM